MENSTNLNMTAQCTGVSPSYGNVFYGLGMSLVMVMSVFGNLLVVVAICMSTVLNGKVTSLFIVSLACSDFCFAVFLIPIKISVFIHGSYFCHSLGTCYFYLMSDALNTTSSILNLLAIAIDRFIAIKTPFEYQERMTTKIAKTIIIGIWSFALICAILGIVKWDYNGTGSALSIVVTRMCSNVNYMYFLVLYLAIYMTSLVAITGIYATILHIALVHIKVIEGTKDILNKSRQSNENHRNTKRSTRRRKRELKTTKSLAIVYGAFIICWLPNCLINLITFADKNFFYNMQVNNQSLFLFIFYAFVEVLPSINTSINPLIYSFSNKQFRSAFKRVLYRLIGKHFTLDGQFHSTVSRDSRTKKSSTAGLISSRLPFSKKISKQSDDNNGIHNITDPADITIEDISL